MKLLKSKVGFTLIELLVVIGILAVLAAIAIPSVAGLIDRANVSADKTNANEMTNAVERFTSEYELYCQDIASGAIKDVDSNGIPDDMDGAQGRVYNVTKAVTRADITALESDGLDGRQINRDTKYPVNTDTFKAVVENYTKTSSSTFEPKQSDCAFYYSPDCGVVVCQETNASSVAELNALIQSGKDAKGNVLENDTLWLNVTSSEITLPKFTLKGYNENRQAVYIHFEYQEGMTWNDFVNSPLNNGQFTIHSQNGHNQVMFNNISDEFNNGGWVRPTGDDDWPFAEEKIFSNREYLILFEIEIPSIPS